MDGRLDDEAWAAAPVLSDFVQKEPVEGAAPTERTEVRFVYDDDALYVGARMYDADPASIQAPVSRRDDGYQAEHLLVSLDTYLDRRTAYTFGVTASGVRLDWYHASDDEGTRTRRSTPCGRPRRASTRRGGRRRCASPSASFASTTVPRRTWGINLDRWNPSREEDDYWVLVPRGTQAWASRFGTWRGSAACARRGASSCVPYVAAEGTLRRGGCR